MQIWIDGDACPKPIKEIVFRAANKQKVPLMIVANHFIPIPPSPWIKRIMVESGFDKADQYILEHIKVNDLVITSDIILADFIVTKKAIALNPKGKLYTQDNIKHSLAMRNLNESLRSSGLISGGGGQLSPRDIQQFSNHLDRIIHQYHR
jgi:uncharacterized protein YaiI (UPF0178 family)